MDNLKMNGQLGTKWFTFYTKVRPWIVCLTSFAIIADFMKYQEIYTSYWWMMVYFLAALVQPVLCIVVFVKAQGDYEDFVRFVKGVLLFETINMAYGQAFQQYIKNEFDIGIAFIVGVIILLLGYFIWYRLNMQYFEKRINVIANDYLPDAPNSITECMFCGYQDKSYFDACPKCGKHAKRYVYLNKEAEHETKEIPCKADKILFCRKCGERLIDDGAFCHKCGTKKEIQANAVDEIQFCPKCGVKIIEGGAFCHKCGAEIATVFEEKIPITDSVVDEKLSGEPILLENGLVKCPACNYVQEANRKVCWNCGYKFDNEKSNASATHTQRCDDYDKTAGQSPCELCGKQSSQLTYAVIKDDMGTRYRNLCDDCITRYNAKPKEEKSEDSVILKKQFVKEEAEGTGGECEICGKFFPKLTYSTIKDDMGTRYRNICDDCIAKYNAKPKY